MPGNPGSQPSTTLQSFQCEKSCPLSPATQPKRALSQSAAAGSMSVGVCVLCVCRGRRAGEPLTPIPSPSPSPWLACPPASISIEPFEAAAAEDQTSKAKPDQTEPELHRGRLWACGHRHSRRVGRPPPLPHLLAHTVGRGHEVPRRTHTSRTAGICIPASSRFQRRQTPPHARRGRGGSAPLQPCSSSSRAARAGQGALEVHVRYFGAAARSTSPRRRSHHPIASDGHR